MSDFWTDRTDEANSEIEALDEPTSLEAFTVTRRFPFRAIGLGLITQAEP